MTPDTPPPVSPSVVPGTTIPLLYMDERLLAVSKPEGVAAIPERQGDAACLRAILEAAFAAKLFVVHRLDKEVSGVIVFARDADMHRHLNLQFSERHVRKTYLALVEGVTPVGGTIAARLREFGSGRMGVDHEGGKPALTRFRLQQRFPAHTLLEVLPDTGRRHQIRVHLYSIGHPIAGDSRYGDRQRQAA
jgi:tRNA pseudouridine32 synthase / 23S rRNA pseudouridine746 synthase